VSEFARRLNNRKLYKCYDVRAQVTQAIDPTSQIKDEFIESIDKCCIGIRKKLNGWASENISEIPRILVDECSRSPYRSSGESKGALDRINVRYGEGVVDLKERSRVVASLKTYKLFRVYFERDDKEAEETVRNIVTGEINQCQKP